MMLGVFKNRFREGSAASGALHVQSTDPPRDWVILMTSGSVEVRRQSVAADLIVRGAASDLELLLYGRPAIGAVHHIGTAAVLDAWYAHFTF